MRLVERTKICTRCGEAKPWSLFHAAVKWEDGTMRRPQSRCKACNAELTREYQQRLRRDDPERVREQDRKRFKRLKADPERMELWRARHRDYQAKRRREAGCAERPECSPYGRATAEREWLDAAPFVAWMDMVLERDDTSINELAAVWGISDKTLREIRNGRRQPSIETVERALIADGTTTLMDIYPDLYSEAA